MSNKKQGCLVCGKEISYGKTRKLDCCYCHNVYDSNAECVAGHFICNACHSILGNNLIEDFCVASKLEDPLKIALILMRRPQITLHGPEHHFLVSAVLLTAYYNITRDYKNKRLKIKEARVKSSQILGGFCGFHGDCGAAVGTGIFISLITNSTPLSSREWKLSNLMTAKSLFTIANHGGPRCCKRNTFLAINEAVNFLKKNFDLTMKINRNIRCKFYELNKECLKKTCPYFPKKEKSLKRNANR